MQAAVLDLLTTDTFPTGIVDNLVAESIRESFSKFVQGQPLKKPADHPNHEPSFYLRVWWAATQAANLAALSVQPAGPGIVSPAALQAAGPSKVAVPAKPLKLQESSGVGVETVPNMHRNNSIRTEAVNGSCGKTKEAARSTLSKPWDRSSGSRSSSGMH